MKIEFNTRISEGPTSNLISFLSRQDAFCYVVKEDKIILVNKELCIEVPACSLNEKALPTIKHSLLLVSSVFYNGIRVEEILISAKKTEAHDTIATLLGEEPKYYKLTDDFTLCATDQSVTEGKQVNHSIIMFQPTLTESNIELDVYGSFVIVKTKAEDSDSSLVDADLTSINRCSNFLIKRNSVK